MAAAESTTLGAIEGVPSQAGMEPIYMTDYGRGIALYGGTKEWKENIKAMGGKSNPNLKDEQGNRFFGWIFGKNKEVELHKFVEDANAGRIKPMSPQAKLGPRARIAAGPRLRYQTLSYKVPLPYVGQGVTLSVSNDMDKMLVVQEVSNDNPSAVDVITLKDEEVLLTGAVVAGVWEILDFGKDHTLTFH